MTTEKKAGKITNQAEKLHPEVKVSLTWEHAFYGPGVHQLLERIVETESIRLACTQMGISYSKGWKLIDQIEQGYGHKVLNRQPGGKDGGKSVITEKGRDLLQKYSDFQRETVACAEEIFKKYFGDEAK